jgi:2-dehydropantoate 2-reductase
MSVCIVGLGAIGGFLAHRLVEGGVQVSALARGATLAAVRERGLVLHDAASPDTGRAVALEVSDSAAALGVQDLVVLSVKTTALATVPASIAPLIGPDTAVLSAMNGVPWWFFQGLPAPWRGTRLDATDPDGRLAAAIDPARIVGCVVHMSASCPAPGTVRQAFGDRFIVGEPGGADTPRLAAIAALLRRARLQVEVTDRIELAVWLKLWGNMTMNPVSALTGATLDRILDDPLARRFVSDAMAEASAIGARIGLPIDMTPEERHQITRKLGAVRTSMLQDVDAGRPIELDALVGSVSEMGRRVGIDTPNIDALLGLTRLLAQTRGLVAAH